MSNACASEEGEAAGEVEASRDFERYYIQPIARTDRYWRQSNRGALAYDGAVLLRLAQLDDMPRLMALIRRVVPAMVAGGNNQWTDDYPNEQVFAQDIEAGELWVALEPNETGDGALAGVAAFTTAPDHEYGPVGWDVDEPAVFTHRLAVEPEQRGKGIAAALMQQAERVARERGIDTLRVDTGVANLAAQRLIVRAGYRLVGEIPLAVRVGLRVLCYERRLGVGSAR